MNLAHADHIADAVLYEGYILYPYRPSVKNHQRWTFGGVLPEAFCRGQTGSDACVTQMECLVHGNGASTFTAVVRFLHLTARRAVALTPHLARWPEDGEPSFRTVAVLEVGEQRFHSWQEAEERAVTIDEVTLGELAVGASTKLFTFAGARRLEPVCGAGGNIEGVLVREQQMIAGAIEVRAVTVSDELFRVTVRVANHTPLADELRKNRDEAQLRSLVSLHIIAGVDRAEFVSLLDPPECWRRAAASCRNIGTWPVLVGTEGQRDTVLSAPIILYDYPQVAPESPGNFFDGTEIDEMLTLRIMTLTDEEKRDMAAVDERARELLARTEALAREQLLGLHGTFRGLRTITEEENHG
jgi:hypothetical protein